MTEQRRRLAPDRVTLAAGVGARQPVDGGVGRERHHLVVGLGLPIGSRACDQVAYRLVGDEVGPAGACGGDDRHVDGVGGGGEGGHGERGRDSGARRRRSRKPEQVGRVHRVLVQREHSRRFLARRRGPRIRDCPGGRRGHEPQAHDGSGHNCRDPTTIHFPGTHSQHSSHPLREHRCAPLLKANHISECCTVGILGDCPPGPHRQAPIGRPVV